MKRILNLTKFEFNLNWKKKYKSLPNSTIYRLTEKFINGLQNDFPTTVATIFRTSDKLVPIDDLVIDSLPESKCLLCLVRWKKLNWKLNIFLLSIIF